MTDYDELPLDTTEGMTVFRNNSANDDGTDTLVINLSWFKFNSVVVNNIYAGGNSWLGFGTNAEQLKVNRRDAKMFYLYNEIAIYHGRLFCKIRWDGYAQYNSTVTAAKLTYEIFLFETGDMFLNMISIPTSYVDGTNTLLINGVNTTFTYSTVNPYVSFYSQDDEGKSFITAYELINIAAPYDSRYLIKDKQGRYYAAVDGALSEVPVTTLSTATFLEYGFEGVPDSTLLKSLVNPTVYYWQDFMDLEPQLQADVTALPPVQVVMTELIEMTDDTILGIENIVINSTGSVLFAITFDDEQWLAHNSMQWVSLAEATSGMAKEQFEAVSVQDWASVAVTGQYRLRFVLYENSAVSSIIVNYLN